MSTWCLARSTGRCGKRGFGAQRSTLQMLRHVAAFKSVYELEYDSGGWLSVPIRMFLLDYFLLPTTHRHLTYSSVVFSSIMDCACSEASNPSASRRSRRRKGGSRADHHDIPGILQWRQDAGPGRDAEAWLPLHRSRPNYPES